MLDASTRAALQNLADIALPQPVSWWPQTWGWAVVVLVLLALAGWFAFCRVRSFRANRYRRAALAELARLEAALKTPGQQTEIACAIAALLKRVALAAWPRATVATLAGKSWTAFLQAHGGGCRLSPAVIGILCDGEYRATPVGVAEARALARDARSWIERHVVRA